MTPTLSDAKRQINSCFHTDMPKTLTHLTNFKQERNSKSPEDLLVEMCNWNQHLILLIQVNLVQRDFLMDTNEIPNTPMDFHDRHKHKIVNILLVFILYYKRWWISIYRIKQMEVLRIDANKISPLFWTSDWLQEINILAVRPLGERR